jgi:predicted TIM-barrel fold metal-dependent hydrolase
MNTAIFRCIAPILLGVAFTACACTGHHQAPEEGQRVGRPAATSEVGQKPISPLVDYHFHLLSPAGAVLLKSQGVELAPIDAAQAVAQLDKAGIRRAVVLSDAYFFDSPATASLPNSYEAVQAENDWTAREVSRFPDRLIAFCGVSPLSDHALAELDRCAQNPVFRGLKLHFDESGVDLLNAAHVAKARRIFAAADALGFPIITHIGTASTPPYGPQHARVFVEKLLPAAPNVTVIVAHLWGGAAYSDDIFKVFADAAATHANLYFEISGDALRVPSGSRASTDIAKRMREVGMSRFLFGSDFPVLGGTRYEDVWPTYESNMPLTREEYRTVAANTAPFLREDRKRPGHSLQ